VTAPGPRRLILCTSVSLDGFVARRDHVIDWFAAPGSSTNDDRRHRAVLELLGQIGLIVLGRGAYEDMVRGWPGSDNPMAVLMNTLPKIVFSRTLPGVEWNNARLSREAVEDEIPELKRQPGNDIIAFGGARFAHALAGHRLIDEYRLTIHPVALGDGLSLLHGLPEPQRLKLVSSTAYADGSVTQEYLPAAAPSP
jgi:dihydrofolate reductase